MSTVIAIAESVGLTGLTAIGAGVGGFIVRILWEKYSSRYKKLRSKLDNIQLRFYLRFLC